jgi:hypothetical protein
MITLGITVAAVGSGLPGGLAGSLFGPAFTPAEFLAALGAATVASLGVLVVRILNTPNDKPALPTPSRHPQDEGVRKAA